MALDISESLRRPVRELGPASPADGGTPALAAAADPPVTDSTAPETIPSEDPDSVADALFEATGGLPEATPEVTHEIEQGELDNIASDVISEAQRTLEQIMGTDNGHNEASVPPAPAEQAATTPARKSGVFGALARFADRLTSQDGGPRNDGGVQFRDALVHGSANAVDHDLLLGGNYREPIGTETDPLQGSVQFADGLVFGPEVVDDNNLNARLFKLLANKADSPEAPGLTEHRVTLDAAEIAKNDVEDFRTIADALRADRWAIADPTFIEDPNRPLPGQHRTMFEMTLRQKATKGIRTITGTDLTDVIRDPNFEAMFWPRVVECAKLGVYEGLRPELINLVATDATAHALVVEEIARTAGLLRDGWVNETINKVYGEVLKGPTVDHFWKAYGFPAEVTFIGVEGETADYGLESFYGFSRGAKPKIPGGIPIDGLERLIALAGAFKVTLVEDLDAVADADLMDGDEILTTAFVFEGVAALSEKDLTSGIVPDEEAANGYSFRAFVEGYLNNQGVGARARLSVTELTPPAFGIVHQRFAKAAGESAQYGLGPEGLFIDPIETAVGPLIDFARLFRTYHSRLVKDHATRRRKAGQDIMQGRLESTSIPDEEMEGIFSNQGSVTPNSPVEEPRFSPSSIVDAQARLLNGENSGSNGSTYDIDEITDASDSWSNVIGVTNVDHSGQPDYNGNNILRIEDGQSFS